jgi:hypothetical protein
LLRVEFAAGRDQVVSAMDEKADKGRDRDSAPRIFLIRDSISPSTVANVSCAVAAVAAFRRERDYP